MGVCRCKYESRNDTHMGAITEEVYSQLITHAVVTLIVGKLNKRDHFLEWSEGFEPLLIIPCFSDGLADLLQTS